MEFMDCPHGRMPIYTNAEIFILNKPWNIPPKFLFQHLYQT